MADAATIAALSSAPGRAGVAVVRISGPQVRFALETIAGGVPPARTAALRAIRSTDGDLIDRGIVLFFPAPASFTGEDVAEIQIHGSKAALRRLLEELFALPGIWPAEPGDFARRAFENGKLDLAEVEGLADLIDSETEWQRRQALRQMDGALGQAAARWRDDLIEALALIDAGLDFSDEGDVDAEVEALALGLIASVAGSLQQSLGDFRRGERIRDGFLVVLAGPPNSGKSSLLNALSRRDAAIVSAIPGTTRDAIEVRLDLHGRPVTLIDTAGLRDSDDLIEAEGVRRARNLIEKADLVLGLRPIDSEAISFPSGTLAVATKTDLGSGSVQPGELAVSVVTGEGLSQLEAAIARELDSRYGQGDALLVRERHRIAVGNALEALEAATSPLPSELRAEEVRMALRALERLVGRVGVDDVLDRLFSGFCIGK